MPQVEAINALEPQVQKLTDAELRAKTDEFRKKIQERLSRLSPDEPGADPDRLKQLETERLAALKEVLDEILVEAFAVVREAGRRVLNMRHFDVQLIGGMVLHEGRISEMKTGEGKTLVATLPVYLNALSGRGVHVVTVNDYLAKRDAEWMGQIYNFLGLKVGVIVHGLDDEQRKQAYDCDVTYGTNNELGFDYLRDNMKYRLEDMFQRDKDYIVRNGEVVIIDEFTGRMMPGRRYSEGLHQALEAKEHQPIQPENQTLASITFQNYFRMYEKLAGMTGTAVTEADEFMDIYNLEVLEIPTNMPMIRLDDDDEVYRTAVEKFRAILALIEDCKKRGQPVLVGTTSIEKSEQLAEMLRKQGWEQHDFSDPNAFAALYSGDEGASKAKVFAVLNARYHEQEAYIVAQAGVPGAITIATNMAGRGTDIQLGGNADMRIRQELP